MFVWVVFHFCVLMVRKDWSRMGGFEFGQQEVSPRTSGRLSHSSGPLNGSLTDSPPVSPSEIDDFKVTMSLPLFLSLNRQTCFFFLMEFILFVLVQSTNTDITAHLDQTNQPNPPCSFSFLSYQQNRTNLRETPLLFSLQSKQNKQTS